MANYYLKNEDASRVYRINYREIPSLPGVEPPVSYYAAEAAFVCDTTAGASLGDGSLILEPDQEVTMSQLVVDLVLSELVTATITEYRTAAVGMIGASWD